MSIYWKLNLANHQLVIMFIVFVFVCSITPEAAPKNLNFGKNKKTVVIDPGHGGHDKGAQGPNGIFEKNVTLSLAGIIAEQLEKSYNVLLTRMGDYWLDCTTRTATANHMKADLFISLHTGGSFLRQARGMYLYYCKRSSGQTLAIDDLHAKSPKSNNIQMHWTHIQDRHQTASRLLTQLMKHHINKYMAFEKSEIKGAPLMVLEGADMPAILIEIGYISNPTEEKSLSDINVLSNIAKGIRSGIDDFFGLAQNSSIP